MMVPGSIPNMIFDFFCKGLPIFTYNFLLEQKYQINTQLFLRACPIYCFVVHFVQTNHTAARFGSKVGSDKSEWPECLFLGSFFVNVC